MPVSFNGCKSSTGTGNQVSSHRGDACIDISGFYAIDPGSEIKYTKCFYLSFVTNIGFKSIFLSSR